MSARRTSAPIRFRAAPPGRAAPADCRRLAVAIGVEDNYSGVKMSKYEWERGTIVIPRAQWLSLRRQLIEDWNAIATKRFALAQSLHAQLTTLQGKDHMELQAQAWRWAEDKA